MKILFDVKFLKLKWSARERKAGEKKIFRGSENLEIPRVGISNVIQFGGYLSY